MTENKDGLGQGFPAGRTNLRRIPATGRHRPRTLLRAMRRTWRNNGQKGLEPRTPRAHSDAFCPELPASDRRSIGKLVGRRWVHDLDTRARHADDRGGETALVDDTLDSTPWRADRLARSAFAAKARTHAPASYAGSRARQQGTAGPEQNARKRAVARADHASASGQRSALDSLLGCAARPGRRWDGIRTARGLRRDAAADRAWNGTRITNGPRGYWTLLAGRGVLPVSVSSRVAYYIRDCGRRAKAEARVAEWTTLHAGAARLFRGLELSEMISCVGNSVVRAQKTQWIHQSGSDTIWRIREGCTMGFSFEAISSKRKLGPETSNKGQDTASDWPAPLPSGVAVTEHRWLMTDS
ncbi:hypothetical protein IEO21_03635 [Rhodonia placenta]|uniref:Uncharacterized protein n=1 Tax=Rhodonia placenta TaxID=104341 RepID=A0A8H7U3Q5_9APHY|nr:hypothetical protein IEO21_03635 [Postia placenta]